MGVEAGTVTSAAAARPASTLNALTRRASLSAAASLLDYVVKAGVQLAVTPVLVSGLGRSLFGIWEMLGRLVGYMSAADGRPTEALRLVVAQRQGTDDAAGNQRCVGAAIVVWVLLLPVVLLVGGILTWLAPGLTQAAPQDHGAVRLTCALLVLTFLSGSLASIPESVLRGMNMGYKRMGLQAGLSVIGGVLSVAAVEAGLGIMGLGGSNVARALLTGAVFWVLVRRYVWWFRVATPKWSEVKALLGTSVWLSVGDLIAKLLLASDALILGAVISPAAVTTYVLTGYAARTGLGVHIFSAGAAIPGLGGLLGLGQYQRAAQARRELLTMTWLFVTALGTTVLLWNQSFMSLWVGAQHYAGRVVDLLIVLITVQTAFIRTDSYVIDAALQPKLRVLVGAFAAATTLTLGIVLTHWFGIMGLCLGMLTGRAIQSVLYPLQVRSCLHRPARERGWWLGALWRALVTALLFGGASLLSRSIAAPNWAVWFGGVVATLGITGLLALAVGPSRSQRRAIVTRLRAMLSGLRGRQP